MLVRPLKLATKDFVEDNHFSAAKEGRLSTRHLIQDDAEGPEVGESARLGFVKHLGGYIEWRAHKSIGSFLFLDIL